VNRGIIYINKMKYREAIDDFSTALRLSPSMTKALSQRGLARLMLHDKAGAREDWLKAAGMGDAQAGEYLKSYL